MTLELNRRPDPLSPALIQSIQIPENCEGLFCGDCVSKVNGESVSEKTFSGLNYCGYCCWCHFVQFILDVSFFSISYSISLSLIFSCYYISFLFYNMYLFVL